MLDQGTRLIGQQQIKGPTLDLLDNVDKTPFRQCLFILINPYSCFNKTAIFWNFIANCHFNFLWYQLILCNIFQCNIYEGNFHHKKVKYILFGKGNEAYFGPQKLANKCPILSEWVSTNGLCDIVTHNVP